MKQTDLAAFIAQESMRWAKTLHEAAHTTLTVVAEDTGPRHTRPLEVVTCEEALGPSGPPQGPPLPGYPRNPRKTPVITYTYEPGNCGSSRPWWLYAP